MAEMDTIDTQRQLVTYRIGEDEEAHQVRYDHLVLALGSVTRLPDIPGLHEFGFELKSLADAVALRDRAIRMLEIADAISDPKKRRALLHWVVVGANFTGAELAGEFNAFFNSARRTYRHVRREDCQITLVEMQDRILTALDPELSMYATKELQRRGVKIRLNTTVTHIAEDSVTLSDGEQLSTKTVIWCAGVAPNPLIRRLALPTDERGYILCAPEMKVQGFDNIWALGDCAVNPDPQGQPYPATAQHAVRQAKCLADNLARVYQGKKPLPCVIETRGMIAALGCRSGVVRIFGFKLVGFPAWFIYRTFYLLTMPGLGRKIRIAIDWTVDLLFQRDYVQLAIHYPRRPTVQKIQCLVLFFYFSY